MILYIVMITLKTTKMYKTVSTLTLNKKKSDWLIVNKFKLMVDKTRCILLQSENKIKKHCY